VHVGPIPKGWRSSIRERFLFQGKVGTTIRANLDFVQIVVNLAVHKAAGASHFHDGIFVGAREAEPIASHNPYLRHSHFLIVIHGKDVAEHLVRYADAGLFDTGVIFPCSTLDLQRLDAGLVIAPFYNTQVNCLTHGLSSQGLAHGNQASQFRQVL
jgi:hypothetical protein